MDICKPSYVRYYVREKYNLPTIEVNKKIDETSDLLKKKWIDSGFSDYSIYKDPLYLYELIKCYFNRSRPAVNWTKKKLPKLKSILDYYNGNGLTTIQISMLWPDSDVFYFNDVANQEKWMMEYCARFRYPTDKIKCDDGRNFDAIFLFEVFEHSPEPQDFFIEFIHRRITKYLVYSAPFGNMAPGHFFNYDGIEGKKYSNHFKKFLKSLGYELKYTGFNQVPLIFEKVKTGK